MNQQVAEMMTAVNDAAQAINNAYLPFVQEFLTENEVSGLALSRCQVAQSALPGPLTADAFTERDPY
ncbi:MAG: hypothetical protein KC425_08040, partial [Anaerolineales bacterium]|nr:hypothetical protein [Anaerolineales bacterium]